ncbi:MAG: hypothetical protein ACQR33_06950 [Candidatus Saccharibacteria bacterium]
MPKSHHTSSNYIKNYLKKRQLAIVVGLCLGSVLYLGVFLDKLGQAGDHHAQIWGLVVAVLSLLASIVPGVQRLLQPPQSAGKSEAKPDAASAKDEPTLTFAPRYVVTGIAVGLLAFLAPLAITRISFNHWQTYTVTQQLQLHNNDTMKDGNKASVVLPPTKHHRLAITYKLTSLIDTGSCVAPAKLNVTPTYNGNDGPTLAPIQSDTKQIITVSGLNTTERLTVLLDLSEEPTCVVKLDVSNAYYYQ